VKRSILFLFSIYLLITGFVFPLSLYAEETGEVSSVEEMLSEPSAEPVEDAEKEELRDLQVQGEEVRLDVDYLKGYLTDTGYIVTSPARWDGKDWLTASIIVGGTLGLYAFDEDIREWFQDNQGDTGDTIANIVEPFGDGLFVIPALGGLYLYGHYTDNSRLVRASLLSLESFVISGVITTAIKFTGHRHRPDAENGAYVWDGPSLSTDNLSFPSGHSATAFSVASVIASEYAYTGYVPYIAYGIASLSALSRIYDDRHWASDVFFGSAIGYFTGKTIHKLHSEGDTNLTVFPVLDKDRSLIVVSYRF
jgi:hypothetical protein